MTETSQTAEFAASAVYTEMCLSSLVTQRPLEEFCCSATFLDLSLSPLTAGRPPSSSSILPPFFTSSPSRSPLYPSMRIGGSHFHVSGGPRQCDSFLSACLIRNSQLALGSSRRDDWRSALSNPGTVRSALLTPVNQIIIWLDLTSTHTLIRTPRV